MNFLDEIKNIKSGKKDLRQFAFLFGGISIALGVYFYFYGGNFSLWFGVGVALILLGFVFPKIFLPFHKAWMTLAIILGFISTRIILTALFYFVIFPIKLFMRKDLLDEKIDKSRKSFWIAREEKEYQKIDTERQF